MNKIKTILLFLLIATPAFSGTFKIWNGSSWQEASLGTSSNYVPYSSATTTVNLNGKDLINTGNVGVMTTSPSFSLDVGGGSIISGANTVANSARIAGNLEVDGKIYGDGSGITNLFGTKIALTSGTVYFANTSGIVYVTGCGTGQSYAFVYSDASNPPTTSLTFQEVPAGGYCASSTAVVLKGLYYKVLGSATTFSAAFTPIGN